MFKKILVANRGEIALRIIRTCQEMDLETVAVYDDADRLSPHVRSADQAVYLESAEPGLSYLDQDIIISAALKNGVDAIHPGYGFLAENADFARACTSAGITFIGPPAQAIEDLGNKTKARTIMENAGVSVIPGMLSGSLEPADIASEAAKMGFPVLIKAVAGGGGKGMRLAADESQIKEMCSSAMGEAQKAFGDGTIYLEKLIDRPRHVEFQILADHHGNIIHAGERECSIQRRYQKIVEETPSPALGSRLRQRMGQAAVTAAKASGYANAGTVEFLLDQDGNFYFLEMNTRLQVEHPITEMTMGIDLVRQQIMIAAGEPLGLQQEDVKPRGHAMECRIYAEDPSHDFLPCPGPLLIHQEPKGPGVRNDCGVCQGGTIPLAYDPLISKLITWGENREAARKRMLRALKEYAVLGPETTISFLLDVLEHAAFIAGNTSTDFIARHFPSWSPPKDIPPAAIVAYVAEEIQAQLAETTSAGGHKTEISPWHLLGSWKM